MGHPRAASRCCWSLGLRLELSDVKGNIIRLTGRGGPVVVPGLRRRTPRQRRGSCRPGRRRSRWPKAHPIRAERGPAGSSQLPCRQRRQRRQRRRGADLARGPSTRTTVGASDRRSDRGRNSRPLLRTRHGWQVAEGRPGGSSQRGTLSSAVRMRKRSMGLSLDGHGGEGCSACLGLGQRSARNASWANM